MTQAIVTKVLPCTNTKPTRIKATSASGLSVVISVPIALSASDEAAHAQAAGKLLHRLGWRGGWVAGATKDGFCFVRMECAPRYSIDEGAGNADTALGPLVILQ